MTFLLRRLVQGALVVFVVTTLSFILIHIAPGDPFLIAEGSIGPISRDVIERNRQTFQTDRPIVVQYGIYIKNLLSGNLGLSYSRGGQPVLPEIVSAAARTAVLGIAALFINFVLGIAIGTWQALSGRRRLDRVLTIVTLIVYSLPVFWLGFLFVFVFVEQLRLFPIGWGTTLSHLVLPSLTLGLIGAAATARFHRDAMFNALQHTFVRTARAKGLSQRAVVLQHVFRTALAPTITLFGLALPILLSGSVFVERVFQWPGIGSLTVDAVERREYHLVTSTTLLIAIVVVASNLFADLIHRAMDPRVRTK